MKLLFSFCVALLTLPVLACAQTPPDTVQLTSLQLVIDKAIKNNPTQAIYQQQIKQALYNYRAAKGNFYPNLSGSFNGQDNLHLGVTPIPGILINRPGTTYYAQFGKQYVYNSGLTLNENIFDWTTVFQTEIAKNNIKLTQVQQASYIQSLKDQAAKLYFSVLIGVASLKNNERDLRLADSLVTLSKQRLQQGTTDAISVNQAIINYNNVLQNKAQSQQVYDQGAENLKILLGEKAVTELSFNEKLKLDSVTSIGNINLGADRGIDVYKEQSELSVLQSRQQRSVAYPTLAFNGYFGAQQFRSDFGLSFTNNAWTGYRYIGLGLNVPLFTGLTNANKYKSTLVQQQIAQLQYKTAEEQSAINDRLLLKNYADYAAMAKASANSFRLYHDNVVLNSQKYQEGIITMDVYLKAFEDYLRAENTYLNNLSQLLSTRATVLSRN